MNLTLNTNPLNNYRRNSYNINNQSNVKNIKPQSFTANLSAQVADAAEQVVEQVSKEKSGFFKPFTKFYDSITDKIAKHFTSKIVNSKPIIGLASKFKDSNNLFQHCLTVGSVITSGLYMEKTLTNDKLDKDRKNTLAVNQGLTWVLSTIGAYSLDKYLKTWWEGVTAKFVGLQLQDKNFEKDFKDIRAGIEHVNKALKNNAKADVNKLAEVAKNDIKMSDTAKLLFDRNILKTIKGSDGPVKSIPKIPLNKFIDKLVKEKKIPAISTELSKKITGMGLLRSMLVFGFVYRYFVPVVVTKPANLLCEKYLAHKKAKTENQAQVAKK